MTFDRPPREAYTRAIVTAAPGLEVTAGLELRDGEHFGDALRRLRSEVETVLDTCRSLGCSSEQGIATRLEGYLKQRYPDRAYFIEIGDDTTGWVQVIQPFGVPRNAP